MMYYIVLWSVIMYFFFSCQRRNDKKVVNDIYYLLNRLRSLWKISQPQSLKFIFILYDVFFLTELRHDRHQVVYGRPGFLLPVGVHLKATSESMWQAVGFICIDFHDKIPATSFLSTVPRLIALFNACSLRGQFSYLFFFPIKERFQ